LRQHILATPLGKKKPLSAAMADDIVDASKIDPEDIIDAKYDDIPKERRNQFEAPQAIRGPAQEGARRGHEEIACKLREDSARRGTKGRIHRAAEPIYFHEQCKH